MKILGIDTSSNVLSIAVCEDRTLLLEKSYLVDRAHSSMLVPKIGELLKKLKLSINKIDAFVVGLGPGSFTGLRIGVSTVKGFGIAAKKPCIGVSSIDAISWNAIGKGEIIVPVIDAKRSQVYSAIYIKKGDNIIRKTKYLLLPIEGLMNRIKGDNVVFLGDGVKLYKEKIKQFNAKAVFLEEKYWYPAASALIKIGFSKIKKTKGISLDKLIPIYLYPRDCQVRRRDQ